MFSVYVDRVVQSCDDLVSKVEAKERRGAPSFSNSIAYQTQKEESPTIGRSLFSSANFLFFSPTIMASKGVKTLSTTLFRACGNSKWTSFRMGKDIRLDPWTQLIKPSADGHWPLGPKPSNGISFWEGGAPGLPRYKFKQVYRYEVSLTIPKSSGIAFFRRGPAMHWSLEPTEYFLEHGNKLSPL